MSEMALQADVRRWTADGLYDVVREHASIISAVLYGEVAKYEPTQPPTFRVQTLYEYHSLEQDEIRKLVLHPSIDRAARIDCSFENANLHHDHIHLWTTNRRLAAARPSSEVIWSA